jgi:hypothetical protein
VKSRNVIPQGSLSTPAQCRFQAWVPNLPRSRMGGMTE